MLRWLPLGVLLVSLSATWLLFREARLYEAVADSAATSFRLRVIGHELEDDLSSRVLALNRMAKRWNFKGRPSREEWQLDAQFYLDDYDGYVGLQWVDENLQPQWSVPNGVSFHPASPIVSDVEHGAEITVSTPPNPKGGGRPTFCQTQNLSSAGYRAA